VSKVPGAVVACNRKFTGTAADVLQATLAKLAGAVEHREAA
jgi:hypothetical protein